MRILNYALIILILGLIGYLINRFRKMDKADISEDEDVDVEEIDIKYLINETAQAFARTIRRNINEDNMSREKILQRNKQRQNLKKATIQAGYGDIPSKRIVKNNVKRLLAEEKYGITEQTIDRIIPFNHPDKISGQMLFEIVLYAYTKKFQEKGLDVIIREYGLDVPRVVSDKRTVDNEQVCVRPEDMQFIYHTTFFETDPNKQSEKVGHVELDFNDKMEILTQVIFEKRWGLGPVDMLIETNVDGVDAGVSGIPTNGVNVASENQNMPYSYESIWITLHGIKIYMETCSFETQEELVRICNNIYKFNSPSVMSRNNPKVVGSMITGARIPVNRPPFSDSYGFYLRKFDSAESVKPAMIMRDVNNAIPITIIKWIVKGQQNWLITGSQGTGKTTFIRSIVRFIDNTLSIRVSELQNELNLRYTYPNRSIVAFQETESVSAQEGLNFQKKTNGDVTIIGEIASAVQASHYVQSAQVASLFAIATHHGKTTKDTVNALANNLLELGLYKDKKDAVETVVDVLNVDCHLTNVKGNRHLERITEIIPLKDRQYPSDKVASDAAMTAMKQTFMDAPEYMRRVTDPEVFTVQDIVRWEGLRDENGQPIRDEKGYERGKYVLVSMPSERMIDDMAAKLSFEDEETFRHEMKLCQRLNDGDSEDVEVKEWVKAVLEY